MISTIESIQKDIQKKTIIVVGAGEIADHVVDRFKEKDIASIVCTNPELLNSNKPFKIPILQMPEPKQHSRRERRLQKGKKK